MYAETGLLFPYFQNTPQDYQQLEEFCRIQKFYDDPNSMNNRVEDSMIISDYDLGGDWDLFKAPETIIEEPILNLDPMTAATMMTCGEDVISSQGLKTLGSSNMSLVHPPLERSIIITNCTAEQRKEKLSRYRNNKTKRNFGRKIKYACRKALADNQPWIRGRFAKTEETTDAKRR